MIEKGEGCVKPTKGPITASVEISSGQKEFTKEVSMVTAKVGKPAPDFELNAFTGAGFKNIKLSDYKGKWIVVCFYPGDFTFV